MLEYERDYMCAKCRHVFTAQADFEQFYTFVPPVACPNPDGCNSFKFSCLSGGSEPAACKDYQEIKIQEQVGQLRYTCVPNSFCMDSVMVSVNFGPPSHRRCRGCQWAAFLVL